MANCGIHTLQTRQRNNGFFRPISVDWDDLLYRPRPSHSAYAASFNCAKANAPVEIAICTDTELSDLDSLLSAEVKSTFVREHEQRQSLLATQRAWLHMRDQKCSTTGDGTPEARMRAVNCLSLVYAERIAELEPTQSDIVGSFDGRWSVTFPCNLTKDACAGRSDVFSLDLWSNGSRLCGNHLATANLGNRVDENDGSLPSIVGTINGPSATIAFKSSWGGAGRAKVTRIGNRLFWQVIDQDNAGNWFPGEEILTKQPQPGNDGRAKSCDATQPELVGPG